MRKCWLVVVVLGFFVVVVGWLAFFIARLPHDELLSSQLRSSGSLLRVFPSDFVAGCV